MVFDESGVDFGPLGNFLSLESKSPIQIIPVWFFSES